MRKKQKTKKSLSLIAMVNSIMPGTRKKRKKRLPENKERICIDCQGKIPNGEPVCRRCQDFRNGSKQLILPRRDQFR